MFVCVCVWGGGGGLIIAYNKIFAIKSIEPSYSSVKPMIAFFLSIVKLYNLFIRYVFKLF